MNQRSWARILIAVAFSISGLVETLGATGLMLELSTDGRWGSGIHTLAVGGPLQLAGAAVLASGRKTRGALIVLGGYAVLAAAFGNLPLIFNPAVGGNALAGLLGNIALIGGIVFCFLGARMPHERRERLQAPRVTRGLILWARMVLTLAVIGGGLYWLHSVRTPTAQRVEPMVPATSPTQFRPLNVLV
jgi:hypothetical protein